MSAVTDIYLSSLQRRLRAMHSLYEDACATMSIEQVNHVERDGVLPISFSLVHQVLIEDGSIVFLGGPAPLVSDMWFDKMGLAIRDHGKELTVAEMMGQRVGDFDALREFQAQVFAATEGFVASLQPSSLVDVIVAAPYPDRLASTFSARVGGERGISRADAIECWIYQHGLRHMGEIEHARALVGLGGLTS
jgi:hypothetical protein